MKKIKDFFSDTYDNFSWEKHGRVVGGSIAIILLVILFFSFHDGKTNTKEKAENKKEQKEQGEESRGEEPRQGKKEAEAEGESSRSDDSDSVHIVKIVRRKPKTAQKTVTKKIDTVYVDETDSEKVDEKPAKKTGEEKGSSSSWLLHPIDALMRLFSGDSSKGEDQRAENNTQVPNKVPSSTSTQPINESQIQNRAQTQQVQIVEALKPDKNATAITTVSPDGSIVVMQKPEAGWKKRMREEESVKDSDDWQQASNPQEAMH